MKTELISLIEQAVKNYFQKSDISAEVPTLNDIVIEYPDAKFGDYSTPIAMSLARTLKKAPLQIATEIVENFPPNTFFSSIEVIKPGFINFKMSNEKRVETITSLINDPNFGAGTKSNENILLEYVSANPTGPLHIGHGRWAVIGDVLARVLKFSGKNVATEFYVNDAGNQVENLYKSVHAVRNGLPIPEDGYHGIFIDELKDTSVDPVEHFLELHKQTLAKLRSHFDNYFRESTLHKEGMVEKMLRFLEEHKFSYLHEGAVWFRTTDYGDEKDRVLVKSDGSKTYFAVDIAYHFNKIARKYDLLINVFGADHHGYIGRLNAAVTVLSENKTKINIIIGQLVSLFRDGKPVRMSKRTGEMITLDEVVDEIGIDASRWYLSMRGANSALEFDVELAKKQSSDNPVFYVQYAHARICSVLKKGADEKIVATPPDKFDFALIENENTSRLAFLMLRFPDEIQEISKSFETHHLNTYLLELATLLHKLYNETKFVRPEEYNISASYLTFLVALKNLLNRGLSLLGIDAPENM